MYFVDLELLIEQSKTIFLKNCLDETPKEKIHDSMTEYRIGQGNTQVKSTLNNGFELFLLLIFRTSHVSLVRGLKCSLCPPTPYFSTCK